MSMFNLLKPDYLRQPPAFFHPRILVGPGVFLSMSFVKQYGITHVINCAFEGDTMPWWKEFYPERYKCLNAIDNIQVNILDWYPEFERTMHAFLKQGTGVVYVHCQAGMNRSGSLALAYTAKNLGMGFDELVASVRRQRPCILQNPVFMNQVKEFINGCVQNSENQGISLVQPYDRYARFFAPGNRSEPQRLEDQAGYTASGDGGRAHGNITPLFFQRD